MPTFEAFQVRERERASSSRAPGMGTGSRQKVKEGRKEGREGEGEGEWRGRPAAVESVQWRRRARRASDSSAVLIAGWLSWQDTAINYDVAEPLE